MSSSQQLYTQVFSKLQTLHPTMHLKRLAVWVWVVVGLIQGQSVQLSEIANHIPGDTQAVGRIARIRRWLASKWIVSRTLYQPLIEEVLQAWMGREVTIILDGCFIRQKALQILRVSLSHCYRALPLAWEVVTNKGNVELDVCATMLDHVAKLLKRMRRVTFLADRGFRSRDWARKCRELDWDYIIRIANNTMITFPGGVQRAADQLGIKKGERRYLPNVRVTLEADWLCNLAITWTRATPTCPAELCVVMTNLDPSGWVLRHYLKRMHIEESFRDDKSGGFSLEASHLTDPKRLDTLLLALSVAVLWVYELGEQVLREDRRSEVDPAYKRQLSVFQLGWRLLRRLISCIAPPPCTLRLTPFKPEPVWYGKC
jgi:Transposase DDE domain